MLKSVKINNFSSIKDSGIHLRLKETTEIRQINGTHDSVLYPFAKEGHYWEDRKLE